MRKWCWAVLVLVVAGDCVRDPTQTSCKGYKYPESDANADIRAMCAGDTPSNRIGCDVWRMCAKGQIKGPYCAPVSILGDICFRDDLPSPTGCASYASLCRADSLVAQCAINAPIPAVLKTREAIDDIVDMCNDMAMEGCDRCTGDDACPNPLETTGFLCRQMPMSQCDEWTTMCKAVGSQGQMSNMAAVCGTGANGHSTIPIMRMYFHTGITDYVLFQEWVPTSNMQYAFTVVAILVMGVVLSFLKALRQVYEARISRKPKLSDDKEPLLVSSRRSPKWSMLPSRTDLNQNAVRALFGVFIITLDYFIMLIFMTFNAGLCVAAVLGLCLGILFFGHDTAKKGAPVINGCCD